MLNILVVHVINYNKNVFRNFYHAFSFLNITMSTVFREYFVLSLTIDKFIDTELIDAILC